MKALPLLIRYAFRSFIRGRSRSLFGAFCVAVGVASVVALGLVGANFQSTLTSNAQKQNRGDVSVSPFGQGLTAKEYSVFARLKAQGKIADYQAEITSAGGLRNPRDASLNSFAALYAIDPTKFAYYDRITADEPSGVPLTTLLRQSNDVVISHAAADSMHLHVGDGVSVGFQDTSRRIFHIRGIVPDNAPNNSLGAGLFNTFVMVQRSVLLPSSLKQNIAAGTVYVKTRNDAQAVTAKRAIEQDLGTLISVKTAADQEHDASANAGALQKFFRVMGLVAVIIGGIGIINTMLVAARRRIREIAVLKAMGMLARQVVLVFVIESLILALAGAVMGVLLGIALSLVVNKVAQGITGTALDWSLHPTPIIGGVLVGLVATLLFSYLPVLGASRARPLAALRSDSLALPTGGWGRRIGTLCLVLLVAAAIGYLTVLYSGIVDGARTVVVGVIGGIGVLIVATLMTYGFVGLIWLVSHLPSFHQLSLRMALRSMGTQKRRLGSTLLALSIGILAVGNILIVAQNVKSALAQSVQRKQNFNVVVYSSLDPTVVARANRELKRLHGLQSHENGVIATQLTMTSVDGQSVTRRLQQDLTLRDRRGNHVYGKSEIGGVLQSIIGVAGRDTGVHSTALTMTSGRNLQARDSGHNGILVPQDITKPLGIHLGSQLVFSEVGKHVAFTVVGIANSANLTFFARNVADRAYMQQQGLTRSGATHYRTLYLKIRDADVKADVALLRRDLPRTGIFDINSFLPLINQLIDKIALLPEIVAALALFAGAVIIANTVALAMLERRREIGVMKAVGATRAVILRFLLVENAIVGFLGALVGVLLAMLLVAVVDKQFLQIAPSYNWITILGLLLLGVALAMIASSLTALPASSEKPMTVLRYE